VAASHKQGIVRQPSPTNASAYRGENAGDGDKGQASPRRHSLGFYKIRKKEAPVKRNPSGRTSKRVGCHWLEMADSIASPREFEKLRGAFGSDWTMNLAGLERMMDDEGLTDLGVGCLRIRWRWFPYKSVL
jgi:hypothetical protein